jgi:phage terminase large subunit GpA-like protein
VWIAAKPGRRVAGFHINALYSPWTRWPELVREFLEAKDIPEHFQTFVNTVLGETYEDRGERVDANSLSSRCEPYNAEVPKGVGILTAAADVQGDRIEFKVKGWGAGEESWLIDYQVFPGDPGQSEVWESLDVALKKQYQHESGAKLGIRAAVVDYGGHHPDAVAAFVRPRQKRKVFAIKGHSEGGRPIWPMRPTKPGKRRVKIFMIGTDTAKDVIFSRLRRSAAGPTRMHFPAGSPDEYFEQLTGEKKVRQLVKGRPVYRYMKTRSRNEALDLEVYNLAALHSQGRAVVDNLDRWVKKIQEIGADLVARGVVQAPKPLPTTADLEEKAADETEKSPETAPQKPRSMPRKRTGWVNRWR